MKSDDEIYQKILFALSTNARLQKYLEQLGVTRKSLENLISMGLIINVDETHTHSLYGLTREGKQYIKQTMPSSLAAA